MTENENMHVSETQSTDATKAQQADATLEAPLSAKSKQKTQRQSSLSAGLLSIAIGVACILVTSWLLRSEEDLRLNWIDDVAVVLDTEDTGHYDSDDDWVPSWRLTLLYTAPNGEQTEFWDSSNKSFSDSIGKEIPILRNADTTNIVVRERPKKPGVGWYIAYGIGGFFVLLGIHECFTVIYKRLKRYLRGEG